MKKQDLQTLKDLSREALDSLPEGISLDGNGIYRAANGSIIDRYDLLRRMEYSRSSLAELDAVIQSLKGRRKHPADI